MADVTASAVTFCRLALGTYQKVQKFVKRAKIVDKSVDELLNKLEQARQLGHSIEHLASSCGARRPSASSVQSEAEPWSGVRTALGFFQQYLSRLDDELGDLGSTSNLTMLRRALLQWRLDGRNEAIQTLLVELYYQMVNVNLAIGCEQM